MIFASFAYLLAFLPVVVLATIAIRKYWGVRAAQAAVLVASLSFYAWTKPGNLLWLGISLGANWLLARWMERLANPAKKRALACGLAANVAFLAAFKYSGWLPFPLGISFFSITQMMYLVDCYEGILSAGTLFDHAVFVAFFPYVISGPIARAKRMRHQFDGFGGLDGERAANVSQGLYLFAMGLFKKAVFADSFTRVARYGYSSATHVSALEAWIFSVAYALELYFDFSGYSDMAIGSAKMLGIEIPRNFDAPFRATSIIEFWQRWHISLTGFITAYLYTPMMKGLRNRGIVRNALAASACATFLAMCVAGLWHGAGWTFVIYGALHGAYLAINQVWRKAGPFAIPAAMGWAMTFTAVVISFAYFGAGGVAQGTARVLAMFTPHGALGHANLGQMNVEGVSLRIFGVPLALGVVAAFAGKSAESRARDFVPSLPTSLVTAGLMLVAMVFVNSNIPTPFVYFKF